MRVLGFVASVVVALVVGLGGGACYAAFAATGSGSGSSAVGAMQHVPLVVATDAVPATALYPGGSGEVDLRLRNPNPFPVWLEHLQQSGPVAVTGGAGCTADDAGVALVEQDGLHVEIPTGNQVTLVRLPAAATMAADSPAGCAATSFTIPVTATVRS